MPDWSEKPGLLFVLATLLPIASFGLLLLVGALRWGLRPYANDSAGAGAVFKLLGGEVTGRGPAYVALAAIALAFACSLTGFILFCVEAPQIHHLDEEIREHTAAHAKPHGHDHDAHDAKDKHDHDHDKPKAKDSDKAKKKDEHAEELILLTGKRNKLVDHWKGSVVWARVWPAEGEQYGMVRDQEHGAILTLGFRIDMLAAVMFVMVTFIATLIHLFSIGYMSDELQNTVEDHEVHTPHGHYERRGRYGRFFMFLSLFCFSMLNLVLTDNLFQIFVSWELVGICSYLLIGFYFERTSASNAANKAFITNRIGDAGFIIGLMIVWTYFGTFNFQEIFDRVRCPERDAHKPIVIDGKPAAHTIVRARSNKEPPSRGGQFVELDKAGDVALIFPRVRVLDPKAEGHFDGPGTITVVQDVPGPRDYGYIPYWLLVAAGLGIFLGCVGKSAQFPLQVWLPDAMEGPTPVSALIHAATMVAAGVYLVGRCYPLFTPEVLLTIAYVGGITLFVAASVAVVMTDIKKVLAYSTVSQLGYMMLALGVGAWTAGLLHLLTHAFFKALLFLGSGSVIYGCHHQQDMLKMGGLYPKMKITALTMLMGVLAIAGTPFFSGWYSKDEILAGSFGFVMTNPQHFLLFLLPLATAGITTFYMFRMWFMTFTGKPRDEHVYEHAHESPWVMTVPLILLAVFSVGVAWGLPPWEPEQSWLGQQLHHYSMPKTVEMEIAGHEGPIPVDVDFIAETKAALANHHVVGALALAVVVIGLAFALVLYFFNVLDPAEAQDQFPGVHRFLAHKWYFDEIYSALLVRPGLHIAHWCRNFDAYVIDGFLHLVAKWNVLTSYWSGKFDRGIIDGFVNLLADVSYAVGTWLRNVQTGYLRSYILFLALAAMAVWIALYAWARALGGP
jgi:NADH-quinone oxidoreductase subunit L